jgi:hypothetical protein
MSGLDFAAAPLFESNVNVTPNDQYAQCSISCIDSFRRIGPKPRGTSYMNTRDFAGMAHFHSSEQNSVVLIED